MSERKTITVRIAVAVNAQGAWNAAGNGRGAEVLGGRDYVLDGLEEGGDGEVIHEVVAEIPVPQGETIEGKVEEQAK